MPSLTPGNTPQQRNAKGPTGGWGGRSKALSFWALVILVPLIFLRLSGGGREQTPEIDYTRYDQQLADDNIQTVTIQGGKKLTGEFRNAIEVEPGKKAKKFTTLLPMESEAEIERLRAKNVDITARDEGITFTSFLIAFAPYLLIIAFWIFIFRQMQAGGAKAFSF